MPSLLACTKAIIPPSGRDLQASCVCSAPPPSATRPLLYDPISIVIGTWNSVFKMAHAEEHEEARRSQRFTSFSESLVENNDWVKLNPTENFKVIILGDSEVGKTTLVHLYTKREALTSSMTTIGFDPSEKTVVVNRRKAKVGSVLADTLIVPLHNDLITSRELILLLKLSVLRTLLLPIVLICAITLYLFIPYCFQLSLWDTAGQERSRGGLVPLFYRDADAAIFVYDITNCNSFRNITEWLREMGSYCDITRAVLVLVGNKRDREEARKVDRSTAERLSVSRHMLFREVSSHSEEYLQEING